MPHDTTLDTEGVDLGPAARLVVQQHAAAPAAVTGAARRGAAPSFPAPSFPAPSFPAPSFPAPDAQRPSGWRFGWGAAGHMWSQPPAGQTGDPPQATAHAIFDLASLTKPVTALLLARMQRAGLLSRDEPLGAFLPEVEGTPSADVSLDLLCAHRAGLHAHVEFFVKRAGAEQPTRATILPRAAESRRPECSGAAPAEGFAPVYSDLGYILVGEALAARGGKALDELVAEHVGRPLGLTMGSVRYLERHEPLARARMVPTENVPWRGGVLHGVVHDENAWVLAGSGSAGHAGLFADVWSMVRLATAIADGWAGRKDGWLGQRDLEPLLRRRAGGSHTAGFDTRSSADGAPMSGSHFGPATFGHLGFTGTSMWIDPERALCAVLLTNRVHPSRDGEAIRAARPAAYDAMFETMMG